MGKRSRLGRSVADHEVRAAGGVVWRAVGDDESFAEIVVVHRPAYDDWTFPKGKLDRGESFEDAALREVVEETGLACELGAELPSVEYLDGRGRSKIVRYWAMTVRTGDFAPNDEVDALEWLAPAEVAARLTYGHDVDVLDAFLVVRASVAGRPGD